MLAFVLIYIVTDLLGKVSWAYVFAPAGRSTLTCYLVPYFYYAVMMLVGIFLPEILRSGLIGVIKSLLFSFLIIFITGLMEKAHMRLKV